MSETWTIPPYPLRWPLKDDQGRSVDTLTFRPIFHGEHAEVLAKHTDDDDRLIALLELATGQTPALLETLRKPDYNSLAARISELVNQNAAHFMSEAIDPDNPRLLVPIDTGGQRLERLTIEVPALKASREMQKISDPQKRSEFITAHCTGLMLPDLAELSVPDWNQLQGRLDDFLNEPGVLVSARDIETITDVVPLVYHVSEAEVLEWDAGKAFRRYELALKRLGVTQRS